MTGNPEVTGPELVDGWQTYRADLGPTVPWVYVDPGDGRPWLRVLNSRRVEATAAPHPET